MADKKKPRKPKSAIVQAPTAQLGKAPDYAHLLEDLKRRIRAAQVRAGLAANRELVLLYWEIGRRILDSQRREGWGAKVVERLAHDLRHEFPEMKGLSRANLLYMRAFADAYPDHLFVQQVAGQIPWFHNVVLLDKVKAPAEREWYIRQTIENGWSRNVLVHQIESGLYNRQGEAVSNFDKALPAPQSELARQILKDPYVFDFLTIGEEAKERDIEKALLEQIRAFLLELGVGFAFVGSQHHLEVGGEDYYIDLLFYLLRHEDDQPSIGIILCKAKNKVIVEYALRDTKKPIGISGYKLTETLPKKLKSELPSVEELETSLKEAGHGE